MLFLATRLRTLVRTLHNAYEVGERQARELTHFRGRSIGSDPIKTGQLISWPMTGLLLKTGPSSDVDVTAKLWPVLPVDQYLMTIPKMKGSSVYMPPDVHRPFGAPFERTTLKLGKVPVELERYGRAGWLDKDQIRYASPLFGDLESVQATVAMNETYRALDRDKAALLADNANFGAVLTAGSWTQDGTMLDDIKAAAHILTTNTGKPRDQFSLTLFNFVPDIATADALFIERRKYTQGTSATLQDVASYLGVKEVVSIMSTYQTVENGAVQFVFPNHAVLHYHGIPQQPSPLGTGDNPWGMTFRIPGVALSPFYEPNNTIWVYPYEVRETTQILDPSRAVLIQSPS